MTPEAGRRVWTSVDDDAFDRWARGADIGTDVVEYGPPWWLAVLMIGPPLAVVVWLVWLMIVTGAA